MSLNRNLGVTRFTANICKQNVFKRVLRGVILILVTISIRTLRVYNYPTSMSRASSSKPGSFLQVPQNSDRDLNPAPRRSAPFPLQSGMLTGPRRSFSHPTPLEDTMISEDEDDLETWPSNHGPFIGPSSPRQRRDRLLRIGTSQSSDSNKVPAPQEPTSATLLTCSSGDLNSYGSVSSPSRPRHNGSIAHRRTLPSLSGLPYTGPSSNPPSPRDIRLRPSAFFTLRRPVTAYDAPIEDKVDSDDETNEAARANGIRVW